MVEAEQNVVKARAGVALQSWLMVQSSQLWADSYITAARCPCCRMTLLI